MQLKDWITIPMAVIAFILSTWNFYSTTIHQVDDLSIAVTGGPFARREGGVFTIRNNEMTVVLINSGNRATVPTLVKSASMFTFSIPAS